MRIVEERYLILNKYQDFIALLKCMDCVVAQCEMK